MRNIRSIVIFLLLMFFGAFGAVYGVQSDKTLWIAEVSAVQEDIYPAQNLCDGRFETRWSSPASDPQYVILDLGQTQTVNGVVLYWETAYSSEYTLLVSINGQEWTEVFYEPEGDGKTDYVFFPSADARYLKLLLTKRATGWGHSLWEVDVCSGENRFRVLAPALTDAVSLIDNDPETSVTFSAPQKVVIDLGTSREMGGIRIDWGEEYATDAVLYASTNGEDWIRVASLQDGVGQFDYLLAPPFSARLLRLDVSGVSGSNGTFQIAGIKVRGPGETLTDFIRYQIAAKKSRVGLYPQQLLGRQVYWTIVGVPDGTKESLFDEYGNLEAHAKGCVLMPYLYVNGTLLSAHDALSVEQNLADGICPMPEVVWHFPEFSLAIEALAWGRDDDAGVFLRYTLKNSGAEPIHAKLFLAVRPLQINPAWQHGGLSSIHSLSTTETNGAQAVCVNQAPRYVMIEEPSGFGACPFDRGDVIRFLEQDMLPPKASVQNDSPLNSGALAYAIKAAPGQEQSIHLAVPMDDNPGIASQFIPKEMKTSDAWNKNYASVREAWKKLIHKTTLTLPDDEIAETVQSQLAYILLNRDADAIQPGSRHYERSWIRDGAMTGTALLRWGLHEPVRDFIVWYSHFITPEGMVPPSFRHDDPLDAGPGSGIEWDGQGAYIALVMDYYRYTGDTNLLVSCYSNIVGSMKYLEGLRNQTLQPGYYTDQPAPERFRGILPKSFSHEGYYPEMHSYWDDFWALQGWKDGAEAARILGHDVTAAWAMQQYDLLAASVVSSIAATIEYKQIPHIPGCAEKGDFDPTSTSITFFPCKTAHNLLPQTNLLATYDRYYDEIMKRQAPEWSAAFTPYEVRNVMAFIELGQIDRAHILLNDLMKNRRPAAWNHWAEVVLGDERMGCYIGDMPHTWVGSGFLNAVALMLVKEENEQIVLLDGIPAQWLDGKGITLKNRPTPFGVIHLSARYEENILHVDVVGTASPPKGFRMNVPADLNPEAVIVNGKKYAPNAFVLF